MLYLGTHGQQASKRDAQELKPLHGASVTPQLVPLLPGKHYIGGRLGGAKVRDGYCYLNVVSSVLDWCCMSSVLGL